MKVIVYTTSHTICPHCKAEKEYLATKNITFEERDVFTNPAHLKEMLDLSEGFSGVPFTMITGDDGVEHKLKGFTAADFDKILSPGATMSSDPTSATGPSTPVQSAVPVDSASSTLPQAQSTAPMSAAPSMNSQPTSGMTTPASVASPTPAVEPAIAPATPLDSEAKNRIDSLLSDLQDKSGVAMPSAPLSAAPTPPTPAMGTPVSTPPVQPVETTAPASGGDLPNIPNFPGK